MLCKQRVVGSSPSTSTSRFARVLPSETAFFVRGPRVRKWPVDMISLDLNLEFALTTVLPASVEFGDLGPDVSEPGISMLAFIEIGEQRSCDSRGIGKIVKVGMQTPTLAVE